MAWPVSLERFRSRFDIEDVVTVGREDGGRHREMREFERVVGIARSPLYLSARNLYTGSGWAGTQASSALPVPQSRHWVVT